MLWLVQWRWFDRFILVLIVLNSVTLGLTDYSLSAIDPSTMEPRADSSWRNEVRTTCEDGRRWASSRAGAPQVPARIEIVFTVLFTLEFVLKVIGRGFFMDQGSYLRNGWNWLDFTVVVSGLLSEIPSIPSVSVLRTLRVLRPLRSLTILPGMKVLVASLLASIPPLMNVVVLLSFIFFVFGILGLQLWSGVLHSRCRLTEFPVAMASTEVPLFMVNSVASTSNATAAAYIAQVVADREAYPWCAPALHDDSWTFSTSPWHTARECVWPIVVSDTLLCSPDESGLHTCGPGQWCGSNYDEFGNPRFAHEGFMNSGTFIKELNYGYTNFDWFAAAFLTIFQAITMEGWVDILYQIQDVTSPLFPAIYFVILMLVGSFFLLNLTLAVIWDSFSAQRNNQHKVARQREIEELWIDRVAARHGLRTPHNAELLRARARRRMQVVGRLAKLRGRASRTKNECAVAADSVSDGSNRRRQEPGGEPQARNAPPPRRIHHGGDTTSFSNEDNDVPGTGATGATNSSHSGGPESPPSPHQGARPSNEDGVVHSLEAHTGPSFYGQESVRLDMRRQRLAPLQRTPTERSRRREASGGTGDASSSVPQLPPLVGLRPVLAARPLRGVHSPVVLPPIGSGGLHHPVAPSSAPPETQRQQPLAGTSLESGEHKSSQVTMIGTPTALISAAAFGQPRRTMFGGRTSVQPAGQLALRQPTATSRAVPSASPHRRRRRRSSVTHRPEPKSALAICGLNCRRCCQRSLPIMCIYRNVVTPIVWPHNTSRFRASIRALVSHWLFSAVILVFIVTNTVILSLDHHPMDDSFRYVIVLYLS